MENKILFVKSIIEGNNELMKEIIKKMRRDEDNAKRINEEKEKIYKEKEKLRNINEENEGKRTKAKAKKEKGNSWMKKLDKYLDKLEMKYEDIEVKDKKEIKEKVKEYDTNKWKEELGKKPSAKLYQAKKKEIKQEKIYDNRWSSVLLFRARANALDLKDRQRFTGGDTSCKLCGEEYEDLTHFMIKCRGLEGERNQQIVIKNKEDNDEDTVGNILFEIDEKDLEETKKMLKRMWNKRTKAEQKQTNPPLTSGSHNLFSPSK